MSWTGPGGGERRGYHHGNPREALVEAALRLIAEKGPAAFTIAEAARLPPARRPPSLMVALHVWSMSHGVAALFARPGAPRRKLPMTPEDLLEAGILLYLHGLGLAGRTV